MKVRVAVAVWLLVGVSFASVASARPPWQKSAPYGVTLMTPEEIAAYRNALNVLETEDEKEAYWLEHADRMDARALEVGIELPDRPRYLREGEKPKTRATRDPYFDEIMTPEEREAYHADLAELVSPEERQAYVRQHVLRMRARGEKRGVTVPSAYEWAYAFESVGGLPPEDEE